jgi:hypothetical protein
VFLLKNNPNQTVTACNTDSYMVDGFREIEEERIVRRKPTICADMQSIIDGIGH